jgi:hypothetical protein
VHVEVLISLSITIIKDLIRTSTILHHLYEANLIRTSTIMHHLYEANCKSS